MELYFVRLRNFKILNRRLKIFINYFLGPLLFVWLGYSIYRQIIKQPQLEASWFRIKQSFQSYKISYLIGAILLIAANWGMEAWKWMISVRTFYPMQFRQAFKAVLSGVERLYRKAAIRSEPQSVSSRSC